MALHELTLETIRGFEAKESIETEKDVRKELVFLRVRATAHKVPSVAKTRALKKVLARILTVRVQKAKELQKASS